MIPSKTLFAALLLHASACAAATYTLHHRIGPSQPWTKRGQIEADYNVDDAVVGAQRPVYHDLTGTHQPWSGLSGYENGSEEFYQIAVTKDDAAVDEQTSPFTFVRACQLASNSDESITVHTDATGQVVLGLNYDLVGLEASQLTANGCPTHASNKVNPTTKKQVSVQINKPQDALAPTPPAAPAVKPDGTPLKPGEEPPKEQSFFRKYWYIILPVVLLMVIPTELADANNDEAENGAGADAPFASGTLKGRAGAGSGGNARRR